MYVLAQRYADRPYPEFLAEFRRQAEYLNSSRPTAVNLSWALRRQTRLVEAHESCTGSEIVKLLGEEAHRIDAENEEMTYDLYLCNRLEAEEIMLLRRRFARRLTKHMHINGSPGFDLNECYYKVTFTATLKSRNLGEYSVEREYAYNTKI